MNEAINEDSVDRVSRWRERYDEFYIFGEDECQCMDPSIPFDANHNENELKIPAQINGKLVLDEIDFDQNIRNLSNLTMDHNNINKRARGQDQKKRKTPVKTKDILEKNKREIANKEQQEMMNICKMLGISKGMHIGIMIYGYRAHLSVYRELLKLCQYESDGMRDNYIKSLNSNKLRDIKAKIGSEGKTGRKQEMIDGIIKKIKELKMNYKRYKKAMDLQQKKRKKSIDSYRDKKEDSEDQVIIDRNHNYNHRKRRRYDAYEEKDDLNRLKKRKISKENSNHNVNGYRYSNHNHKINENGDNRITRHQYQSHQGSKTKIKRAFYC